jgi:UDP-glucose 4-epimerase
MAFHKFIKAALTGGKIEIYGDGNQTRDFTFINDIIEANVLAMNSNITGEVFNIGGGTRISINEVLKIINKLIKKKIQVSYIEKQKGDVRHTSADIGKAARILGYQPKVNLEEGLKKEIEWLK